MPIVEDADVVKAVNDIHPSLTAKLHLEVGMNKPLGMPQPQLKPLPIRRKVQRKLVLWPEAAPTTVLCPDDTGIQGQRLVV